MIESDAEPCRRTTWLFRLAESRDIARSRASDGDSNSTGEKPPLFSKALSFRSVSILSTASACSRAFVISFNS